MIRLKFECFIVRLDGFIQLVTPAALIFLVLYGAALYFGWKHFTADPRAVAAADTEGIEHHVSDETLSCFKSFVERSKQQRT